MPAFENRLAPIDYIKAIAILAVAVTHAGPIPWLPDASQFDFMVRGVIPLFHVPSFLIVAGFLYATEPLMSIVDFSRRLTRILVPYLVASLVVLACNMSQPADEWSVLFMLATGSTLGIYYFVFILVASIAATFVLTQASPRLPTYALIAGVTWWIVKPLVASAPPPPLPLPSFWFYRDPRWFYPYFLMGWVARLHWPTVAAAYQRHKRLVVSTAVIILIFHLLTWTHVRGTNPALIARAAYVLAFVTVVTAATEHIRSPGLVLFASEASYTLYLYHFLFMVPLLPLTSGLSAALRAIILVTAGLLGAAAVAAGGRKLLGARSRFVFGT